MLNRQIEMACRGEKSRVRGYHDIWAAAIGEELVCGREPTNMADRYAVAVLKKLSLDTCQGRSRKCVPCSCEEEALYAVQ